jgi:hypothetical protein
MKAELNKMPLEVGVVNPEKIVTLLKPGELGAMLDWTVHDPQTGKIKEQHTQKSESFVQAFIQLLFIKMAVTPYGSAIAVTDTGNTARNMICHRGAVTYKWMFETTAAATVVINGIIIGTGNTAPVIGNYAIETLIPHATMNYSAVTWGLPAADATTSQLTITRNFSNVSGGAVTVNEIALYCMAYDNTATVRYFCIIRDVIAGGIAVPNGQTLTVNYRPQAVV